MGAALGGVAAFIDVKATLKQYADAKIALEDAAKAAEKEGLPGLAGRLATLSRVAGRRSESLSGAPTGAAVGAGIAGPSGAVAGGIVGAGAGVAGQMFDGEPGELAPDEDKDKQKSAVNPNKPAT